MGFKKTRPMAKTKFKKFTLDCPATYKIEIPGELDPNWVNFIEEVNVTVDNGGDGLPLSVLTCRIDQAGLIRLLRCLYSLGIPLLSVICVDDE